MMLYAKINGVRIKLVTRCACNETRDKTNLKENLFFEEHLQFGKNFATHLRLKSPWPYAWLGGPWDFECFACDQKMKTLSLIALQNVYLKNNVI